MLYMQNLTRNTPAKPLPASNFPIALGSQDTTWLLWQCDLLATLQGCHPQNTVWLVGHSLRHFSSVLRGASQPPGYYLLLDNWCWAQQNEDILKKKKGENKSMWRD